MTSSRSKPTQPWSFSSSLTLYCRMILEITSSKVEFGLVPHDHWFQPDWIDEKKAAESRGQMIKDQVIYGGLYCIVLTANSTADWNTVGSVPYVRSLAV